MSPCSRGRFHFGFRSAAEPDAIACQGWPTDCVSLFVPTLAGTETQVNLRIVVLLFAALAVCFPLPSLAQTAGNRLSGSGILEPTPAQTADGRFAINAKLNAAPAKMSSSGFVLAAQLIPNVDSKAIATACAVSGNDLFRNGFEN